MTVFERGVVQENIESPQPLVLFQNTAMSAIVDVVKASPGTLFWIQIDNSLNTTPVFLQLFDNASPTVGVTAADEVIWGAPGAVTAVPRTIVDRTRTTITLVGIYDYIPVPGSSITVVSYLMGANPGKVFSTAITAAVVVDLAGAVSPTNPVSVT